MCNSLIPMQRKYRSEYPFQSGQEWARLACWAPSRLNPGHVSHLEQAEEPFSPQSGEGAGLVTEELHRRCWATEARQERDTVHASFQTKYKRQLCFSLTGVQPFWGGGRWGLFSSSVPADTVTYFAVLETHSSSGFSFLFHSLSCSFKNPCLNPIFTFLL